MIVTRENKKLLIGLLLLMMMVVLVFSITGVLGRRHILGEMITVLTQTLNE